jgi:hypothetical protein
VLVRAVVLDVGGLLVAPQEAQRGGERVTTERLAQIRTAVEAGDWFDAAEVEPLLAEVERLTEALETVIRENAAGYDNLKRRLEQLREERDRLAALLRTAPGFNRGRGNSVYADWLREVDEALPVREDAE